MSIEDPRPGDRFRVTFEGTYQETETKVTHGVWTRTLNITRGFGMPWSWIEHAVSVEPIFLAITPGLYMDADGRAWKATAGSEGPIWLTPLLAGMSVHEDQAHTIPGLRRARLVPEVNQ